VAPRRLLLRAGAAGLLLPLLGSATSCTRPEATSPTARDTTPPATPTATGDTTSTSPAPTTPGPATSATSGAGQPGARTLLVFYSRAGQNYSYGARTDLQVGNTDVAAQLIASLVDCDVHRLEAAEPYPHSYDDTVARNVREQDQDARPTLAAALPDTSGYDVVLLGSPIWNVRPPMLMSTAVEGMDLAGTRVLPFVTYAVSGLGSTERVYAQALPNADLGPALAIRGEQVAQAGPDIRAWLQRAGLLPA